MQRSRVLTSDAQTIRIPPARLPSRPAAPRRPPPSSRRRFPGSPRRPGRPGPGPLDAVIEVCALIAAALTVGVGVGQAALFGLVGAFAIAGVRRPITGRVSEELPGMAGRLAAVTVVFGTLAMIGSHDPGTWLTAGLLGFTLTAAGRVVITALRRRRRERRRSAEPVVILGAGKAATTIAQTLLQRPELGLLPIGFLDSAPSPNGMPLPMLGTPDDLARVADEHGARQIIVAFGAARDADIARALRLSERLRLRVYVVPRLFELGIAAGAGADELWGLPLQRVDPSAVGTWRWRVKRLLDIVMAVAGLVVAAPLFAVIALAVRWSSPGPILFRQERVGQHGRSFELLKFRSMLVNDDALTTWSVADDDRRTPVGRFLRKTHLDELPQLLNVLAGDMAIVGPRPERSGFVERFSSTIPGYADRHRVPVGLTGWSQVHGLVGDTSIEDRARLDNYYIDHWSLWRDLVIVLRTPKSMASSNES